MEDATSGERAAELRAGGGAGGEVHSRKRKEAKADHLNGRGSVLPAEQSLRLIDEKKWRFASVRSGADTFLSRKLMHEFTSDKGENDLTNHLLSLAEEDACIASNSIFPQRGWR